MQKWDDYRYVMALARCGSMTAAAKALDTNPATVSRHIHRITELYGTVLFVKKKTRWDLTRDGEALVEVIEAFEQGLSDLEAAGASRLGVDRPICCAVDAPLLLTHLAASVPALRRDNPGIRVEFLSADAGQASLADGEIDLALRLARPREGGLMGRRIAEVSYVAARREGSQEDGWIALGKEHDDTPEMRYGQALFTDAPTVRVPSFEAARALALSTGLGVILPQAMVSGSRQLARLRAATPPVTRDVWLVFYETRKMDPIVRVLGDWAQQCFVDIVQGRASHVA
ncbi:LysR family transcriptional regulator [Pseudaestuariivita sp.]|uniref:LysR family transcriptional regulator n=1 Tax=Pseudaestuariivita sp. TaxID=2211669 RepID=UPI004058ED84